MEGFRSLDEKLKLGQSWGLKIETMPNIGAEGQNWLGWVASKAENGAQRQNLSDYRPLYYVAVIGPALAPLPVRNVILAHGCAIRLEILA